MTKAKGNMYDWINWLNDPLHYCSHECQYCYAKRWQQFIPELNIPELRKIKNGMGKIFICHLSDMFCGEISAPICNTIFDWCKKHDNTYIFQTKNPARLEEFINDFPDKSIIGITLETNNADYIKKYSQASLPIRRITNFLDFKLYAQTKMKHWQYFITIEPIMDFDILPFVEMIKVIDPDFINIGADSKHHHLPEPSAIKIRTLIGILQNKALHIKIKDNLKRLL